MNAFNPQQQLLRAGAPRARRPVQSERQQRLQHRAPARLQQRRTAGRVRLRDAAGPRRLGRARRIHARAATTSAGVATSTRSAARPTAAPASTARRSAACGTRCSAKAATGGSSRAPTGTTAACSARRPPLDAGLLSRRVPAQLHDGAHPEPQHKADAADDRRRPAHRQQLSPVRPADRSLAFVAARRTDLTNQRPCATSGERSGARRWRWLPRSGTPTCSFLDMCARWAKSWWCAAAPTSSWRSWCATRRARTIRRTRSHNPSLAQVGISQPLNTPVLDHIDVIGGLVTGYKTPGDAGLLGSVAARLADDHGTGHRGEQDLCRAGREEHQRGGS